jgi:hypothetical protein
MYGLILMSVLVKPKSSFGLVIRNTRIDNRVNQINIDNELDIEMLA